MQEVVRHLEWIARHLGWAHKHLTEMPHSEKRVIAYQQLSNANKQIVSTLALLKEEEEETCKKL